MTATASRELNKAAWRTERRRRKGEEDDDKFYFELQLLLNQRSIKVYVLFFLGSCAVSLETDKCNLEYGCILFLMN